MQCCAEILQLLTAEHLRGDVQQREGRFIYHIRMNREGLITVEDDRATYCNDHLNKVK